MKELIEYLVKSIVNCPEEVRISELSGDETFCLEMRVAKEDIGRVIGKDGRTIKALRTILNAVATKKGTKATLEILE